MTDKERYEYRKANGLCVVCGKPNDNERVRCLACNRKSLDVAQRYLDRHKEERNEKIRKSRDELIEKGYCPMCKKPNNNGKRICDECAEKANKRKRDREAYLKSVGRCIKCRGPAAPGKTLCAVCALNANERQKELRVGERREKKNECARKLYQYRKDNGLCVDCGKPKEADADGVYCIRCGNKRRVREADRTKEKKMKKENGICLRCDKPALHGYCYCEEHLEKQRAYLKKARESADRTNPKKHVDCFWSMRFAGKGKKQ